MNRDVETFEHSSLPPGHTLREHCLYRLSRENWQAQVGAIHELPLPEQSV